VKLAEHPYLGRISKPLAAALALFALAFLLQLTPHTHTSGQDEAACGLCQVAHVGVTTAVSAPILCAPLVSFGLIATVTASFVPEAFFSDSASRAPPSSIA
jgi:hypothetical protein